MKINKSASKMITRTLSALALTTGVAAASVADNQELLASKVDSANAHRGLEVTGAIRGIAQMSSFSTDQDTYGLITAPDVERNEFVNADLNFGFRPWESVRANVMLRLYAGMQEYFAAAAKIIEVPWLNVEGQIGKNFYWVAGDFRQQYTPLTLFAPGVDILYEPTVYARQRHMAEKQQLLEGNQRNLQGINLQFRKDLNDILGEVRAEGMFARVARAQALDLTGAEGNILPNNEIPGATLAANMDKFLLAGNLELFPLKKNAYIGATAMYIFDNEDSYSYTYRHYTEDTGELSTNVAHPYFIADINPFDITPQKTLVIDGRFGADVAGMLGNKNLILDATAELALSQDKAVTKTISGYTPASEDYQGARPVVVDDALLRDPETDDLLYFIPEYTKTEEDISGLAFNATLNAGYKADGWSARLVGDVIYNDADWFNNMAQSPKFFAQRILNADIDGNANYKNNTVKYGVNAPLYTTFDALYNFAPKFTPVAPSLKTDDNGFKTQTESFNIANYNKNSWGSNVYSKAQLALLQNMADPNVQMILPNGTATSNREGIRANVIFNVSDWLEAQGLVGVYSQVTPDAEYSSVSYMDFGGGAKADIFKVMGFSKPLEFSGSYRHTERSLEYADGSGKAEMKTDFINAGLYVQYLPRLGVTAGFQLINMEMNDLQQKESVGQYAHIAAVAPLVSGQQMQWMVGLDYTLDKNVWLSLNFGMVNVENTYNTAMGTADNAVNLPTYAKNEKAEGAWPAQYTSKFSQTLLEASINVEF